MNLQIGTGSHGDTLRSIAGAGSAANQIEYLTRYGTALPLVDEEDLSEDDKVTIPCCAVLWHL